MVPTGVVTAANYVLHKENQVLILDDVRNEDKELALVDNTFNVEVEGLHYVVVSTLFADQVDSQFLKE